MRYKLILISILILFCNLANAARIKDITSINGVRSNYLIGYGLVIGLDGTGDNTDFTAQSFKTMLNRLGITLPDNLSPKIKNVAAVVVHADLPPFAKPGGEIDITVSSIGNAKSLRGGTLLYTPLKGADGNIYAVAQGNLVVGGLGASGSDGSKITVNVPVVGRVPNGATVERVVPNSFHTGNTITFNLHQPDFTTANRIAKALNNYFGNNTSYPQDAGSVILNVPEDSANRVQFIAAAENLDLTPGDAPAKIIVNSRTGTIVIGKNVRVTPAAVTHGNLTVTITESQNVSQPEALSTGNTVTTPETQIQITRDNSRIFLFNPGLSLEDIVRAVNQVGAAPGDLMAILEALKQAGAIHADLEII